MKLATALNAVCPYYTMYPLDFPLGVLARHAEKGDWVLDPFCGRGTTNFAARLCGLPSFGIDSSPVAVALAKAKLASATPEQVKRCAEKILSESPEPNAIPDGEFWGLAFEHQTLDQLCRLRESLISRCDSDVRILLRAIILGALHGPQTKGTPSHFSNQCMRTFAPKPDYAVRFWRKHGHKARRAEAIELVHTRATRYLAKRPEKVEGKILRADSRSESSVHPKGFRWVITSPPYYGMRTYIPDQWLRSWFLGGPAQVVYGQPQGQLDHSSPDDFAEQLADVLDNAAAKCADGARLVVRFGGIRDRCADPREVLLNAIAETDWRLTTIRNAGDADQGKRQARYFQKEPDSSVEEFDVYAQLV